MTTEKMDKWNTWQDIDWKTVDKQVFKLQKRIYKASQSGDARVSSQITTITHFVISREAISNP
jgi:N-terminal domain of reverse transcriptase